MEFCLRRDFFFHLSLPLFFYLPYLHLPLLSLPLSVVIYLSYHLSFVQSINQSTYQSIYLFISL